MHPPKRISQEVELAFRYLADSCFLFVDRELQLTHDLVQSLQGLFGFALPAQDHEVVGIEEPVNIVALAANIAESLVDLILLAPEEEQAKLLAVTIGHVGHFLEKSG